MGVSRGICNDQKTILKLTDLSFALNYFNQQHLPELGRTNASQKYQLTPICIYSNLQMVSQRVSTVFFSSQYGEDSLFLLKNVAMPWLVLCTLYYTDCCIVATETNKGK